MKEITDQQRKVLDIIVETTDQGRQASMREICERLGFASSNSGIDHLRYLEQKGYIRRSGRKSRCIEILFDSSGYVYEPPVVRLERLIRALGCENYRAALRRVSEMTKVPGT